MSCPMGPQIYDSSTCDAPDNLELHTSRKHGEKQSEFRTLGRQCMSYPMDHRIMNLQLGMPQNFEPPRVDTRGLSTMGIVIDIPYGPQLYAPSGENRKHRISPHDSYFHVHKHVNHQHGTSHELNFPQSQTTNYRVRMPHQEKTGGAGFSTRYLIPCAQTCEPSTGNFP